MISETPDSANCTECGKIISADATKLIGIVGTAFASYRSLWMGKQEPSTFENLPQHTLDFYVRSLQTLDNAKVPFLVSGAYAVCYYAGIDRHTKDLDVFLKQSDVPRATKALERSGCRIEFTHPHWLAKALDPNQDDPDFVDLIYASGNGSGQIDDSWFPCASRGSVLGHPALICAPEELIYMKAFVMARERFDGADINHLVLACGPELDWRRLIDRFGDRSAILLAHLIMFQFVYPSERQKVPDWVTDELIAKHWSEAPWNQKVCRGTLLSWDQYLIDVQKWGFADARVKPYGPLTQEQVDRWTKAEK